MAGAMRFQNRDSGDLEILVSSFKC
jgi:hypothetical protein